jgi:hypothetical protein
VRLGAAQALFGGLDTVGIGEPDREMLGECRQWWGRNVGTGPKYVGEGLGRHIAQMIGEHAAEAGHPGILPDLPTGCCPARAYAPHRQAPAHRAG